MYSISLPVALVMVTAISFSLERPDEAPSCGGRIEPGRPLTERSLGDPCDYDFEGEEGILVTVAVVGESQGFDPRVWLLDPDGEEEAFDDDSGGDGSSLIAEHKLRRTGTYVLSVASYGDRAGAFKISLERAEPEEPDPADLLPDTAPPVCGGIVHAGQAETHELWDVYCEFPFEGAQGQIVDIAVTSLTPGLDPRAWLLDPAGAEVAFDDDGGSDGNSLIQGYELLASGFYVIRVGSYEQREGQITLALDILES